MSRQRHEFIITQKWRKIIPRKNFLFYHSHTDLSITLSLFFSLPAKQSFSPSRRQKSRPSQPINPKSKKGRKKDPFPSFSSEYPTGKAAMQANGSWLYHFPEIPVQRLWKTLLTPAPLFSAAAAGIRCPPESPALPNPSPPPGKSSKGRPGTAPPAQRISCRLPDGR